ncbi:Phospholipase/Carboxylesterase-domain-containing protein [Mycena galopus ATCC 62051]|nr:Phospholipase/Carboxylesterase-domain-containing protein [Mycena galopus ATCC 62051]
MPICLPARSFLSAFAPLAVTVFVGILAVAYYNPELVYFLARPEIPMTAIAPLKFITVPALSKHTATVIFVHGLGDSGNGWKPVADMFKELSHVKWVLPHAPQIPVTASGGMQMPAWFDLLSFDFAVTEDKTGKLTTVLEDQTGMLKTVHSLNKLITAEVDAGIPANRIVLGGFSQGGAMSVLTGLTTERKLAGLALLSCWLPLREKIKSMVSEHAASIPIFWAQGDVDPLVKPKVARMSADLVIKEIGTPVSTGELKGLLYKTYEGVDHSTNQAELEDLKAWLKKALPPNSE